MSYLPVIHNVMALEENTEDGK